MAPSPGLNMVRNTTAGRLDRRTLLKSSGVAAAVGLAGCGGDGGDNGDGGGNGGDTGGGTPTEQGPSDRAAPYLEKLPDYYPESYWRTIDGAMDESGQTIYTAYFGAMAQNTVDGFNEVFDFIDWNVTTLGTAEVFSRFTTEASRGQVNPDVLFTYDPIAMRQLYTAGLLENYVSPNVSETDVWPDRTQTDVEGMVQLNHSWGGHTWNPSMYDEAGLEEPGPNHTLEWYTDHIEDNPDFYNKNTAQYDGITSTSAWQQMDFYTEAFGEDWMVDQYETMASTDPRSFWSTSTMGGWVGNGEVAYAMGMAQWIVAAFIAEDFDVGTEVQWGKHVMHNVMHPNYQAVADADNPNSGRLFADWAQSPHGNAWICRNWNFGPGRTDIPDEELSAYHPDTPDVTTSLESIQASDEYTMLDGILMDFNERTTRTEQKSKYKDMWYNTFN